MLLYTLVSAALAEPLVAVVVIDEEAREQGFALELEDLVVDDALPVDVGEGERIRIIDPGGGRHALDVAPGEAWSITGRQGQAWMAKLGEEVRTDVLEVRGEPEAVRALAEALGAELRVEEGRLWLVADGILFDAPWVDTEGLDPVDEVSFVPVEAESQVTSSAPTSTRGPAVSIAPAVVAPVSPIQTPSPTEEAPPVAPESGLSKLAATLAQEPAAPQPTAPAAGREPVELDPTGYAGLYLCGDGTALLLTPSQTFSHSRGYGEWHVSAPGVVRLVSAAGGKGWRAAIEVDRNYCRAVW